MQRSPPPTFHSLIDSIKQLASDAQFPQAFASFSLLRVHSPSPSSHLLFDPILSLLTSSVSLKSFCQSKQLHSLIISFGFLYDPTLLRHLTTFYSSSGLLSDARRVAEDSNDVSSWNILISSYVNCSYSKNAINAYKEMLRNGVEPNIYTYPIVLKACGQVKELGLGREVHMRYRNSGLEWNVFVYNALVAMYAKCGDLGVARGVFDEMGERDSVSWNSMISAYACKEMWGNACEVFERMREQGVEASCLTWNTIASMKLQMGCYREALGLVSQIRRKGIRLDFVTMVVGLNACSRIGSMRLGKQVHAVAIRSCCDDSETVTNTLISMYSRCKDTERAHLLFRTARARSLITWNSMITGFAINDKAEEATMFFREFVWSGNEPNYITIVTILALCARVANFQHGRELHCFIIKHGFKNYRLLWNSLVDMYSKSGKISIAQTVFNTMTDRDQISYTSLISGYGVQGDGMKALQLFEEMVNSGIEADDIAMVTILSACSHSGLVSEGQHLFDNMENLYRIKPKMEHYSCMVDLYARAGILEKSEEILDKMPMGPSEAILAALLNACLVHKNTEIGERAARKLLEMKTRHAGHYVLIANIYASSGCWEELAKVRILMRDRGVRKAPGCALIDNGIGFSPFLVGDRSSPLAPEIYMVLEGLIEHMRDVGYVDNELGFDEGFGNVRSVKSDDFEDPCLNSRRKPMETSFRLNIRESPQVWIDYK